jgi:FixJ family two-component response regulator
MVFAIVDDDDDVRRALARLLGAMGHAVREFASAEEFETAAVSADCLIVDVRLPGLSGLELHDRVRMRSTPTPVVLISGGERPDGPGRPPVVTKPFDEETLMAAVTHAMTQEP